MVRLFIKKLTSFRVKEQENGDIWLNGEFGNSDNYTITTTMLQTFPPKTDISLYVEFWNSKMGRTWEEISNIKEGIRQADWIKNRLEKIEEKNN